MGEISIAIVYGISLIIGIPLLFFVLGGIEKVTIEKSYFDEYETTLQSLEECKAMDTLACAPCECKQSSGGIILLIFGGMMYILGILKISDFEILKNFKKKKGE